MMDVQKQIKVALYDYEFGEDLAERIYRSMRFEREDYTPEWERGGNSHAQQEARACMAGVVEIVRSCLIQVDVPDVTAEQRAKTAKAIHSAVDAAIEAYM